MLAHFGRPLDAGSFSDFSSDFLIIRTALYAFIALYALSYRDGVQWAPLVGFFFLVDPWRSAHRRASFTRGARYLLLAIVLAGVAISFGMPWERFIDPERAATTPTWSIPFLQRALTMFAYCIGSGGLMMWLVTLIMPRR